MSAALSEPSQLHYSMAVSGLDPVALRVRGRTADSASVHVVVVDLATGRPARVASFKGSEYDRALVRAASHAAGTGQVASIARGTRYAFLPFPGHRGPRSMAEVMCLQCELFDCPGCEQWQAMPECGCCCGALQPDEQVGREVSR